MLCAWKACYRSGATLQVQARNHAADQPENTNTTFIYLLERADGSRNTVSSCGGTLRAHLALLLLKRVVVMSPRQLQLFVFS